MLAKSTAALALLVTAAVGVTLTRGDGAHAEIVVPSNLPTVPVTISRLAFDVFLAMGPSTPVGHREESANHQRGILRLRWSGTPSPSSVVLLPGSVAAKVNAKGVFEFEMLSVDGLETSCNPLKWMATPVGATDATPREVTVTPKCTFAVKTLTDGILQKAELVAGGCGAPKHLRLTLKNLGKTSLMGLKISATELADPNTDTQGGFSPVNVTVSAPAAIAPNAEATATVILSPGQRFLTPAIPRLKYGAQSKYLSTHFDDRRHFTEGDDFYWLKIADAFGKVAELRLAIVSTCMYPGAVSR